MKILRKFEQWLSAQYRKQERAFFERGVRHAQLKLKQAQEQLELAPAKLALEVEGHYDEFAMGVRHALADHKIYIPSQVKMSQQLFFKTLQEEKNKIEGL